MCPLAAYLPRGASSRGPPPLFATGPVGRPWSETPKQHPFVENARAQHTPLPLVMDWGRCRQAGHYPGPQQRRVHGALPPAHRAWAHATTSARAAAVADAHTTRCCRKGARLWAAGTREIQLRRPRTPLPRLVPLRVAVSVAPRGTKCPRAGLRFFFFRRQILRPAPPAAPPPPPSSNSGGVFHARSASGWRRRRSAQRPRACVLATGSPAGASGVLPPPARANGPATRGWRSAGRVWLGRGRARRPAAARARAGRRIDCITRGGAGAGSACGRVVQGPADRPVRTTTAAVQGPRAPHCGARRNG